MLVVLLYRRYNIMRNKKYCIVQKIIFSLAICVRARRKEWVIIVMNVPKDPMILLSFINTHLRDRYPSLEELCKSLDISMEEVTASLGAIDYHYQVVRNQFL